MNPATLVALALAIWGVFSPPTPIVPITLSDPNPSTVALAVPTASSCPILLSRLFAVASPAMQLHIIIHEVGHCLGASHTDSPNSIMTPNLTNVERPTAFDYQRLGITTRRSLFVPMIVD